jgi:hypothetical protein
MYRFIKYVGNNFIEILIIFHCRDVLASTLLKNNFQPKAYSLRDVV